MTFYVCKQCNYKHTFLPFACAKCKGTNFYPLITSEPTRNTSVCNGMEIQEDVLKLRIENEQLKKQIEEMKCCGNCSHRHYWGNELGCNLDYDKEDECNHNNKKYWEFRQE